MTSGEYEGHIMDPQSKKIIRTLIENPEREFNKKELAEVAGVSRDALYRRWEPLNQLGILQDTGSNYKLKRDKSMVYHLRELLKDIDETSPEA